MDKKKGWGEFGFKEYIEEQFQKDLQQFLSSIPDGSKHRFCLAYSQEVTSQRDRLFGLDLHLARMDPYQRARFGVALFFVVLMDMVMYVNEYDSYPGFRSATRYWKCIESCSSACQFRLHHSQVFEAMCEGRTRFQFILPIREAVPVMQDHFRNLFARLEISEVFEFAWGECLRELPFGED